MSSGSEVFMDTGVVRQMAKNFGTIGEVMDKVSKTLEMLSTVLKTTAFIGFVGGAVVSQYIDAIQPRIDQLAADCKELNDDLDKSVDAYERGDAESATRFH